MPNIVIVYVAYHSGTDTILVNTKIEHKSNIRRESQKCKQSFVVAPSQEQKSSFHLPNKIREHEADKYSEAA